MGCLGYAFTHIKSGQIKRSSRVQPHLYVLFLLKGSQSVDCVTMETSQDRDGERQYKSWLTWKSSPTSQASCVGVIVGTRFQKKIFGYGIFGSWSNGNPDFGLLSRPEEFLYLINAQLDTS